MNPNDAILALLAELRMRVAQLDDENAALRAQLEQARGDGQGDERSSA